MTEYLIELYPADFFFFANDRINHPDVKDAYYTRSAYFPQQTGLLGMLRYQLLLQNAATKASLVSIPKEKRGRATALAGLESFSAKNQSFGVIQTISPLFLTRCGENGARQYYHTLPCTEGQSFIKHHSAIQAAYLNGPKKGFLPWMPLYDSKEGLAKGLMDDNGNRVNIKDIFLEMERTGITKSAKGTPDSGAFYRQLTRGLKKDYAFAFLAKLADKFQQEADAAEEDVKFGNALVSLGAERSAFFMKVTTKPTISFGDTLPEKLKNDSDQVICVSDTFLPENLAPELFDFMVGETTLFNSLKTSVNQANFYTKPELNGASQYLIRRGSVFFTSRKTELIQNLRAETSWTNIGFNHCI